MATDSHRERVEQRLNRVKRLFLHLAITLALVLLLSWSGAQFDAPNRVNDLVIPLMVLLFVGHALWVAYQEASLHIVDEESQHADQAEKPKRGERFAINDEGELVDAPDEQPWDDDEMRSHHTE